MPSSVITARVDQDTLTKFETLATATHRSKSWLAAKAIREFAEREADFIAFIQAGTDAIDRGEVLTEAEMDREFDRMRSQLRATKQAA